VRLSNINIDLMFAIPEQNMKSWQDTLKRVVGLDPEHISFYSLQIEEGTAFYNMFREGRLKAADDRLDRDMYHTAVEMLEESGYLHYEISNAAKAGRQCLHNLKYWSMEDYLGLGLGAHSFLDGTRFGNVTDLSEYIRTGGENIPEGSPFTAWTHRNTADENISEYLITGMRKMRGIDLTDFEARFGATLESIHPEALQRYQKQGLIEIEDNCLRFTKKGIDISNRVLAEFV
jgi:oxygen-independent coproporphyrinogen-3 oxidase